MYSIINKRATVKLKNPNPLFEQWITEWIEEATIAGNGLKSQLLTNALNSLRKYPLVLNTGRDCMILEHFDTNICIQLDRKLVSYNKNPGGQSLGNNEGTSTVDALVGPATDIQKKSAKEPENITQKDQNKQRKSKEYIPAFRSAAYALLMALHKNEEFAETTDYMAKDELMKKAQPICNTSLKRSQPGSFYTGWSAMSKLISKNFVMKINNPVRFKLTEEGRLLAKRLSTVDPSSNELQQTSEEVQSVVEIPDFSDVIAPVNLRSNKVPKVQVAMEKESDNSESLNDEIEEIVLSPATFDIILLVDTAEISSSGNVEDKTISLLTAAGIQFEVRHLKVGDFLWICRSRTTSSELVLPFIVERKRMDDLAKSIKDGRYHEQKFRLKKCKIYNTIYLVEEISSIPSDRLGLPLSTLRQAMVNTSVIDGFTVKTTSNHCESMLFLTNMTTIFKNKFQNKVLFSCNRDEVSLDLTEDVLFFPTFKSFMYRMGKHKNLTIKDMFIKQLMKLHGLSGDKAWAIVNEYATPAAFISALNNTSVPEQMVSNIRFGLFKRRIGPVISKRLHHFYTQPCLK